MFLSHIDVSLSLSLSPSPSPPSSLKSMELYPWVRIKKNSYLEIKKNQSLF